MRLAWQLAPRGTPVSARNLRWILLGLISASCVGLVLLAAGWKRNDTPLPRVWLEPAAIQGFRTALYRGERLRLRVSADSLSVSNTKVFGPFSLGFMRSIAARNVTVETYADGADETAPSLASPLRDIPALFAQQRGVDVAGAELAPIRVVEHRSGQTRVALTAASCSAGMTSAEVVCSDGLLDRGGSPVHFHRLSYDRETLKTAP
jgi:hypothetical protein